MRLLVTALLTAICASSQATLVIRNGRVWTGEPKQPWAEAVAIVKDRIAAVGANVEIASHIGATTEIVDAAGRLVIPGFNDAHVHLLTGSLGLDEIDLTGICILGDIQKAIARYAGSHPKQQWLYGGGWEYTCFPGGRLPVRADIDAVVKDRPVYLRAYDGHTGWANSKALELAGINKDSTYSGFGEIVRDASGQPTGVFKESAESLVTRLLPVPSRQQKLAALERGLKLAASLGITSIQNASGSAEELSLYEELLRTEKLTLRVSLATSISPDTKPAELAALASIRDKYRGPMLRMTAGKLMMDGVIESHTAAMLEPYSDDPTASGKPQWTREQLATALTALQRAGVQVYTHAIGDAGVRLTLDAYEAVFRREDPKLARWRIEHIETISPDDLPRFAKLGVLASMQPIHADPDGIPVWSKAVGEKRLPLSFPWRSLESAGAKLVFSSDWPASLSLDPIRGIHMAVNRQTSDGRPPGGWLPEQRVSVETALRAYTSSSAFASFEEDIKGTIRAGKLADIVILSQDLLRVPAQRIHETKVDMTIFGGKVLHRRCR